MNEIFSGLAFFSSVGMAIALTGNQIDQPAASVAAPPLFATQPATQPATLPFSETPTSVATTKPATPPDAVLVDLSDRQLCFKGECYPAWIGGDGNPTPTGKFQILEIGDYLLNGKGEVINHAPVLVLEWRGNWAIAIHGGGTKFGGSTLGCVRLSDEDTRRLAGQVSVGTEVLIQE